MGHLKRRNEKYCGKWTITSRIWIFKASKESFQQQNKSSLSRKHNSGQKQDCSKPVETSKSWLPRSPSPRTRPKNEAFKTMTRTFIAKHRPFKTRSWPRFSMPSTELSRPNTDFPSLNKKKTLSPKKNKKSRSRKRLSWLSTIGRVGYHYRPSRRYRCKSRNQQQQSH